MVQINLESMLISIQILVWLYHYLDSQIYFLNLGNQKFNKVLLTGLLKFIRILILHEYIFKPNQGTAQMLHLVIWYNRSLISVINFIYYFCIITNF